VSDEKNALVIKEGTSGQEVFDWVESGKVPEGAEAMT